MIETTRHILKIPRLPRPLSLVHISDLHINSRTSDRFLKKICCRINALKPDMILYTGDFICRSGTPDKRLDIFLNSLTAPLGCFAVLGNHDYAKYININARGEYDSGNSTIFRRLFKKIKLKGVATCQPPQHEALIELLRTTPFKLLHNETVQTAGLNICGLGEHMAGYCDPEKAFSRFDVKLPGIILLHNPDGIPALRPYPGDLILCGHTHGGQINLPLLRDRITLRENAQYLRGLLQEEGKWIYINRGLGRALRLFSPPEIAHFSLVRGDD